MRDWEQVAYLKICAVQTISYRKLFCGRAHIVKDADEIGQNRLIRPLVAFKMLFDFYSLRRRGCAQRGLRAAGLLCGMDLYVVRFARAASGLNFRLNR